MKSKECCVKKNKTIFFTVSNRRQKLEEYSELCQTSKVDFFYGFQPLTIFALYLKIFNTLSQNFSVLSMPLEATTSLQKQRFL